MPSPVRVRSRALAFALLVVPVAGGGGGVGSPAYAAAEVKTTNACYSSFETRNRDLDMTLAGTAAAASAAGGTVTLSGVAVSSALPDFMPVFGYNLGILQAGRNDIAANVHVAVAGTNTVESVQILDADVTATTTVTDPDATPGTGDETATPVAVTVTLPNSVWTPSGSGPVEFRQAAPGTLPEVAGAGPGGGTAKPTGSIFVGAVIGPAKLSFDCQPGTTDLADLAHITPSTPAPFASATVAGSTSASGSGSAQAPTSSAEDESSTGAPIVPIVIGAIVVLAAGGFALSRRRSN